MGRSFQASNAKQGRRVAGDKSHSRQADKANYRSFYNVQKTKLTARYPFLPSNQIERRIKHLWESASAEKRATFCSSLGGTTPAKSPFRGSILKGLLKSVRSPEQPIAKQQQQQCQRVAGSHGPLSASSPRVDQHPRSTRQGILRSSEKKRQSTPRVSFRLDPGFMLSPISADQYPKQGLNLQPAFDAASHTGQGTSEFLEEKGAVNPEAAAVGMTATKQAFNGNNSSEQVSQESDELQADGRTTGDEHLKNQLSTADVNVVNDGGVRKNQEKKLVQAVGTKATKNKNEDMMKGDDSVPSEPKEDCAPSTPSRRSTRAAAIAAKTKMMSPVPGRNCKDDSQEKTPQSTKLKTPSKVQVIFRLKKTELSMEEKQMYEFEDDSISTKGSSRKRKVQHAERTVMVTRPRLQRSDATIVKNPEEYNLDSKINKVMFGSETESQSQQLDSQDADIQEPIKMQKGRHQTKAKRSVTKVHETQPKRKRGRPIKSETDQVQKLKDTGEKKKRGRPKKYVTTIPMKQTKLTDMPQKSARPDKVKSEAAQSVGKGKKRQSSLTKDGGSCDDSQVDEEADGRESVPWIVSAHPSSSSDEEAAEAMEDSDEDAFQHYERDDSSSMPSAPDSQDLVSSSQKVCENFESFCRTNIHSIKGAVPAQAQVFPKSPLPADVAFGDQDFASSMESIEDAEIMSISTEYSMSSASEMAFPGEEQFTSKMDYMFPSAYDTKTLMSRKQKMRLEDGAFSDSSQLTTEEDDYSNEKQILGCRRGLTSLMKDVSKNGHVKQPSGLDRSSAFPVMKGAERVVDGVVNPEKRRSVSKKRAAPKNDFTSSSQDTDESSDRRKKRETSEEKYTKKRTPSKTSGGSDRSTRNKRKCADLENMSNAKTKDQAAENTKKTRRVGGEGFDGGEKTSKCSNQPPLKKPCRPVLAEKNVSTPLVHTGRTYVECRKSAAKGKVGTNVRNCRKSQESKPPVGNDRDYEDKLNGERRQEEDRSDHGQKSSEDEENAAPGDGLLCDLFQPNEASMQTNRRYIAAQEAEQVPQDPVASHLFQEENFFD